MGKFQGVFQRIEQKYLLTDAQYRVLCDRLAGQTQPDAFGRSTICNLYYDTPDFLLARTSAEKPVYKEKLRLRCYGIPSRDSTAFAEIKKKFRGVVYKRRVSMSYAQAEAFLGQTQCAPEDSQIAREIGWFLRFYPGLAPQMAISYDRDAVFFTQNPQLRITFDQNILWRTETLDLTAGVWGTPMLTPGQRLMEVKIPGAVPVSLARTFAELNIREASFSKYGRGYEALFRPRLEQSRLEQSRLESSRKEIHLMGGKYCA